MDGDGDPDVILSDRGVGPQAPCRTRYYVNRTRQLYAAAPPARGATWHVEVFGPPGGQAVLALAGREASLPLGTFGTFGLDPAATVVWPSLLPLDVRGVTPAHVLVPAGLPLNTPVFAQALVIDPRNRLTHLTNVWDETIR